MRKVLLLALLALAGCATLTDVSPIGEGRYMVGSAQRGGTKTDVEVKAAALQRANSFCREQSKQMTLVSSTSSGVQGWTTQNAEVVFMCQ